MTGAVSVRVIRTVLRSAPCRNPSWAAAFDAAQMSPSSAICFQVLPERYALNKRSKFPNDSLLFALYALALADSGLSLDRVLSVWSRSDPYGSMRQPECPAGQPLSERTGVHLSRDGRKNPRFGSILR